MRGNRQDRKRGDRRDRKRRDGSGRTGGDAPDRIRAFIAVSVSDEIRSAVHSVETELKSVGADIKWVRPENVHITLKFLGNIRQEDLEGLKSALTGAIEGECAFEATVDGLGTFPRGGGKPRVVWMGLEAGVEDLTRLAAIVEDACASVGFERERRPFAGHLTIGRSRRGGGRLRELAERVPQVRFNPLQLKVDEVNLVRSRLSPEGPTYTVLESFTLSGK
jgi:2'-5' RNA ligase